jgi:hypothetical protein
MVIVGESGPDPAWMVYDACGLLTSVLAVVDREVFTAEWPPEIDGDCASGGRDR